MQLDPMFEEFISGVRAKVEAAELDRPHVVLQCDPLTGFRQAFGPFADAYVAASAAKMLHDRHEQTGLPCWRYDVIPYISNMECSIGYRGHRMDRP